MRRYNDSGSAACHLRIKFFMTSNEIGMNMPADDSHWELYVTYVDDNPAVLMVDIGIAELAPISEKPFPGLAASRCDQSRRRAFSHGRRRYPAQ